MFLQVLDDGRLTDGQGRTVSFKDAIIIMTSNAGTGKAEASVGFGAAREGRTNSVLGELGNFFSPEFMNRFDGIIEFKALSKENLLQIVDLMLDDVNKRLSSNNIHLDVTEKVKEKLVDLGYDPKWELVHSVVPSKTISKMPLQTTTLKIQVKKTYKAS